ncbi:MAG: GNAT family N-acetyltransferase [bacterium]|jgi:ribosomal protein S18 acetylase RimI-like enzyme
MIRRCDINDVKQLQNIGVKTFDDTFGNTCTKEDMRGVLDLYFNSAQVASELQDDTDNFFFFEEEDIIKGYMRINAKHDCPLDSFKDRKCIELVRLYVLKEFHGVGVANKLMQFAIDFARNNSFEIMYLSVWEYNFRARGFYEKHGFVNSGIENDFPLGSTPQTDYWFFKEL